MTGTGTSNTIQGEANMTFNGTTLAVTGSITATGDITAFQTSDNRLKENIIPILNALEKVRKLNGVKWEWSANARDAIKASPAFGLIAQNVNDVVPEVIRKDFEGYLQIDYSKLVGLLIEAIKELDAKLS
jgi:hypothetical protein